MTVIDLAAWAQRLDVDVAEVADVLNGSTRRAGELLWGVVRLEEALRRNPDPEIRVALRSAETALGVVVRRLEEVWLVARRETR